MDNSFSINHPLLFILAGIAVLAVALQSVVFLRKAWTRAKELGFSEGELYQARRQQMLEDKIDVATFFTDFIERLT